MSLDFLEEFYNRSIRDQKNFPEGYANITDILSRSTLQPATGIQQDHINQNFIITESQDKLTLFNSDFVIWLVPELVQGQAVTHGYIALHHANGDYKPELAFEAIGEYNQSGYILQALQLYLDEIKDTEKTLRSFTQDPDS